MIGGGQNLQKLTLNLLTGGLASTAAVAFPPGSSTIMKIDQVTALASYQLIGATPTEYRVLATTSSGRVWCLDEDLNYVRQTDQIDTSISGGARDWYSNRIPSVDAAGDDIAVGHLFTVDHDMNGDDTITLYLAELADRFQNAKRRIMKLEIDGMNNVTWLERHDDMKVNVGVPIFEPPRFFEYQDHDSDGTGRHIF